MILDIIYSKKSQKFLNKNSHLIKTDDVDKLIILAIKKIKRIEDTNIDLKDLKPNRNNFYRIRKGDIRIIFYLDDNGKILVANVNKIGFRGDVYK